MIVPYDSSTVHDTVRVNLVPTVSPCTIWGPPSQWVPQVFHLEVKRGQGVTLSPHLMPRSRMSTSYTSSPLRACMACIATAFTFNFTPKPSRIPTSITEQLWSPASGVARHVALHDKSNKVHTTDSSTVWFVHRASVLQPHVQSGLERVFQRKW
jgi:hypothetical protein